MIEALILALTAVKYPTSGTPDIPQCVSGAVTGFTGYPYAAPKCSEAPKVFAETLTHWAVRLSGQDFTLLPVSDGSIVAADLWGALYHLGPEKQIRMLEGEDENASPLSSLALMPGGVARASDDGRVYGFRFNGTVAFSFQAPQVARVDLFYGGGTLWLSQPTQTFPNFYMVRNEAGAVERLNDFRGIYADTRGNVYTWTSNNVMALLRGFPSLTAQPLYPPVRIPTHAPAGSPWGSFFNVGIRAIGSDGSLWTSTITSLIHIRPDGSVHDFIFDRWLTTISMVPMPIRYSIGADGSAWLSHSVRVLANDTIQQIQFPQNPCAVTSAADGTVWYVPCDLSGIVHARLVQHVMPSSSRTFGGTHTL
jgi:hypothetical protein